MIKNISHTLLLVFFVNFLFAQQVEVLKKENTNSNMNLSACADQFAGNVSIGNIQAQSLAVSLPGPIFLCYEDRFTAFNSNADLTGDPNNTTAPGVGYAFFECDPTATGPDLSDIEADPCVLTPIPTSGDYDFWVYTDQPDGTALFQNSDQLGGQTIPEFFNGGDPIQIYFAPITFDNFNANSDEDGGMCINMNADEAFPVVYLNEIEVVNCIVNPFNGEWNGSFFLEGGYPEYNGSTYTSVVVIKGNNFNNQAEVVGGPFMHGDMVEFVATEPGTYTILIEDGISCGIAKQIVIEESDKQMTITATAPPAPHCPGDFVCVSFTVEDFISITSMSFTINFNPNVLQFSSILPCPVENLTVFNLPTYGVDNGFIPFSWFQNAATGVDLNDGDCLFDICFDVIGDPGECSLIFIDETPTTIEVGCCDSEIVELFYNEEEICVCETADVEIFAGTCGANGGDEGSVTFHFAGGTGPYTYTSDCFVGGTVATANTPVTVTGLTSGNCTINVTDNSGSTDEITILVSNDTPIDYELAVFDPTCYGIPNGRIALRNISGGNPDYNISWSNGIYEVDSVASLPGGTYFVTIEDQNGCQVEQAVVVGTDPILVDIVVIDTASCENSTNGTLLADAFGGTPIPNNRYDYQWSSPPFFDPSSITSTITDVPFGTGVLEVTDDNGCSVQVTYDMPYVKEVTADIVIFQPLCADSLGRIEITGGTTNNSCAQFAFTWANGVPSVNNQTMSIADDLVAGDYFVTITDCDGCELDTMITIDPTSAIMLPKFVEFDCTMPTGCITYFPGGGTSPISFQWADDPTTSTARCGLVPGWYYVTATDANGCMQVDSTELVPGSEVVPDQFFVTPISCAGDMDGVITVDVLGPGPYDFSWSGPDGPIAVNDETISGLGAGWYYLTVEDDMGCQAFDSVEMVAPDTIFTSPVLTLPSCNGEQDGSIALVVSGGNDMNGYTFSWDGFPGNVSPLLNGIGPGEYMVTVFDSQGCGKDTSIVLPDQDTIVIMVNVLDGIDCNGENNAVVEVVFTGGKVDNGNYGVIWSSAENEPLSMISTDTAYMLGAGMNQVIVFDEECADTLMFDILEPDLIQLNMALSTILDPTCFGDCDGTAQVEALGGDNVFTYTWVESGNVSPAEAGLCEGKYYVDIEDGNGCIVRDSITVSQPDSLVLQIDLFNTFNPACNNEGDGIIAVDYNGGNVGPVSYTWTDNVSDDASASGLVNGVYSITVEDEKGCTDTTSYRLTSPPPVTADVPAPETPICFGDRTCIEVLNPMGGSGGNYRFSINNSNLFPIDSCVLVFAGEYVVSVYDGDGCSYDTTIVIDQPSELLASVGNDFIIALGDSTTSIEVQLNQSFVVDTIIWTSTQPYECIDPDCERIFIYPSQDAIYTVLAIDENGCTATDEVFIRIDDERKVYFPNIFSPNGDGINDKFQLYTGQGVTEVVIFQVYDRWGNKMFEVEEIAPNPAGIIGWDGTFKGQSLDPGVYSYRAEITFIDEKTIPYTGTITLVR